MNSTASKYGQIVKIHYTNSTIEIKNFFNLTIYKNELDLVHIEIDQLENTYVNEHQLTLMMNQLAEQCYSSIFPITFLRNSNSIQIVNNDDIIKKWKIKKPEIESYFKGQIAVDYCNQFEKVLSDELLLNEYLQRSTFIFYLTQVRTILGNSYVENYEHLIPIMPSLELPFITTRTFLEDKKNEDDLIYFEIEAEQSKNYSNFLLNKLIQVNLIENNEKEFKWNYQLNGYVSSEKIIHNLTMIIKIGNSTQSKIEIDIAKMT